MNKMLKYLNPLKYFRRIGLLINRYIFCWVEKIFFWEKSKIEYPPIFVVGPPRSGSTLTIQLIIEALEVGYLTNRHVKFFGMPFFIEFFFNPYLNRPAETFSSNHGRTKGSYAPSEAGNWWYRFFAKEPPHITLEHVDHGKMLKFRRSVSLLMKASKKPVIFKNMYETVRMQPIKKYIPESLFIVLERKEIDNAHSLLETRYKVFKNYNTWWSVKTPEYEKLIKCRPGKQVIEQIRGLHKIVKEDLSKMEVDPKTVFNISYDELCKNPEPIIQGLQKFLAINGCPVNRTDVILPKSFTKRTEVRIDEKIYNEMINYAENDRYS